MSKNSSAYAFLTNREQSKKCKSLNVFPDLVFEDEVDFVLLTRPWLLFLFTDYPMTSQRRTSTHPSDDLIPGILRKEETVPRPQSVPPQPLIVSYPP